MTEKSYPVPASYRRTYRYPVCELPKASNVKKYSETHVRKENETLICAETEIKEFNLESGVTNFFCTDGEVYAQAGRKLYILLANVAKTGFTELTRIVKYVDELGGDVIIALSEERTYRLKNNTPTVVAASVGGSCMCFFRDRMFIGGGMRLNYSEPLFFDKMNDTSPQKSGYIDLLEDGKGTIIETVNFNDKLYLFRERGITEFTGYGDPLDFRLKEVPCHAGEIIKDTVANCGDKIFFMTEAGLFSFNGSAVKPEEDADCSRMDLTSPVYGVAVEGVYYASVVVDGLRILYRYDGRSGYGRYLSVENEKIAARGKQLYFLWKDALYSLGERALPVERERCNLQFTFCLPDIRDRDRYLEGFTLTGDYLYEVTVSSEYGSYTYTTNGRVIFPRPLRGDEFHVKIVPQNRMFRFKEIAFHTRRDENWTLT